MGRTKQPKNGSRRQLPIRGARPHRENDLDFMALKQEAERRERIFADRRRTEAKWRPKIPEVRKVNFENFKNRFQDIDQPDYAIDVLVGGAGVKGQIRREQGCRRREEISRLRQSYLNLGDNTSQRRTRGADSGERAKRADKRTEAMRPAEGEMQRIRVQSQPVLGHLTSLLNDTEHRSSPRTFMAPFKALVYFQPKMRQILSTLEEKWADYEELDTPDSDSDSVEVAGSEAAEVEALEEGESAEGESAEGEAGSDGEDTSEDDDDDSLITVDSKADEDFDGLMDSPEALRDMRCYVSFVDSEVMPLYTRFDDSSAEKVRFFDLWSLYRPGDLIYMPVAGEVGSRYHEVWRIYKTTAPGPQTSTSDFKWHFFADDHMGGDGDDDDAFQIKAYYIDHDGSKFGVVRRRFGIESFVGSKEITSLEVYPIRYRPGHQQLIESLKEQGRKFINYLDDRHQQYSAWTLTRNPPSTEIDPDEEILVDERDDQLYPEFLESDVVVDPAEAFQDMPHWRLSFHYPALNHSIRAEVEEDDMPIQHWLNGSRHTIAYTQNEIIQTADGVETRQRRDNLNHDTFLRRRVNGSRTFETNPQALNLREEDLVLVTKRMFAYALRERRFVAIDLNLLKPVRREKGVFDNLRIQDEYKDVVRGLVMSHFRKKELERRYAADATDGPGQDLIQGKGRGLVVLLHGVPGVGKTATAEAVAMESHKPLFVITCGDLGLTPYEVEATLKNVFRLAHLWDCVLLLDEADVFLAQRSQSDMTRNALVSVFLRVLEYYNGLLFLTTNRVGTIDEAFKSRIHLSLYYAPLDKHQTRDIFRLNIAKLKEMEADRHRLTGEPALIIKENEVLDFAASHYEDLARSTGCWNGRQIRSAFQIASSLALHGYTKQVEVARSRGVRPPAAPVLNRALFDKVQMSTQSFDRHMKKESAAYDADMPGRGSFSGER